MPKEKLELEVETTWDDRELDNLEEKLDSVDRKIAGTGKGRNEVEVDVEVNSFDALTELEVLDEAIDDINDRSISVGFDGFREPGTSLNDDGRGSQFIDDETGQFISNEDALTADPIDDLLDDEKTISVETDVDTIETPSVSKSTDTASLTDVDSINVEADGGRFTGTQEYRNADLALAEELDTGGSMPLPDDTDLTMEAVEARRNQLDDRGGQLTDGRSFLDQLRGLDMPDNRDNSRMDDFMRSIVDARFSMENFHNIIAALIPVAALLIGALPAAITAIGGLAGAAIAATAALGGIGLLGLGGMALTQSGELDIQPILNRMQGVFDTFVSEFSPLMETFAPVVRGAIDDLENMAAPLADASSALTLFRDEFEQLSAGAGQLIPNLVTETLKFTQFAMPALKGFVGFLGDLNIRAFFQETIKNSLPALVILGKSLRQILPAVISLSVGLLNFVAILGGVAAGFAAVLNALGPLGMLLGFVIGGVVTLISATTALSLALGSLGINAGAAVIHLMNLSAAEVAASIASISLSQALMAVIGALTLGAGAVAFAYTLDRIRKSMNLLNEELGRFSELSSGDLSANVSGSGSATGSAYGNSGSGSAYDVTVVSDGNKDRAARESYSTSYEIKQREQVNSVFGG